MFDRALIYKLICVGMVAAVMLPAGGMLFPYVSDELSGIQFHTLEAVVGASLGLGLFTLLG